MVIRITTSTSRATTAPMESGLPLLFGMPYREFVDSDGLSWRVWTTVPSAGSHLRGGFEHGWLTFESTTEGTTRLRRLVPVPREWEEVDDARLEMMCKAADEVSRFTRARTSQIRDNLDASDAESSTS
jgi:hypothetical protein